MPARKHGIVFVCGAFHEPVCFDQAKDRLLSSGFNVVLVPKVASVGEEGSGKSAADDAKAIQAQIQPYIDDGHELIVIGHSYGAYPGWAATEGLTVAERAAAGEKGGVRAFVGVAAGLPLRPGSSPRVVSESADNQTVYPPFCNHGPRGNGHIARPIQEVAKGIFYNDMGDTDAEKWASLLVPQCQDAFDIGIPHDMRDPHIPVYYIVCTNDKAFPPDLQRECAAGVKGVKVLEIESGHAPFLSQVDRFVGLITRISASLDLRIVTELRLDANLGSE